MAYAAQCVLISFFGALSGGAALMVKDIASTVGDAVFMVHGGISAHRETCLTVENGKASIEGAAVVLEDCVRAIGAGDGRELWTLQPNGQLRNTAGNKCAGLSDNDLAQGGNVVLMGCDAVLKTKDVHSQWEVLGDGQISLKGSDGYCLSQSGHAVGRQNVAAKAAAVATSTANAEHGAVMAVDNNEGTYWASKFDDTMKPVALTLDVGEENHVQDMTIEWEFPAKSFSVSTSTDGNIFTEAYSTDVNNLMVSQVPLGQKAKLIKIVMTEPHALHGKYGGHAVYGIASVSVFANQLDSVVDACTAASKHTDARDKYFLTHVAEFNPQSSKALESELPLLEAAKSALASATAQLSEIVPQLALCKGGAGLARSSPGNPASNVMMTEQLLREPLATAIQDRLDVEGIRALLGEARSNILEVRKVLK